MFNWFKKENKINDNNIVDYTNCIEIARIISSNDIDVINQVSECVNSPIEYFNSNKDNFENRGIYNQDNLDQIIWIGMVDILINNNYLCERDYKDEIEDFIYFINELKSSKKNNIIIDKEMCGELDDSIPVWCENINSSLKEFVIGAIDIDSDSYIMFICQNNDLDKLKDIAKSIKHRIDLASKM